MMTYNEDGSVKSAEQYDENGSVVTPRILQGSLDSVSSGEASDDDPEIQLKVYQQKGKLKE